MASLAKAAVVRTLEALDFKTAANWTAERLTDKINSLGELRDDEIAAVKLEKFQDLITAIRAKLKLGEKIVISDPDAVVEARAPKEETPKDEEPAPADPEEVPAEPAKKKSKKAKAEAPAAEEESAKTAETSADPEPASEEKPKKRKGKAVAKEKTKKAPKTAPKEKKLAKAKETPKKSKPAKAVKAKKEKRPPIKVTGKAPKTEKVKRGMIKTTKAVKEPKAPKEKKPDGPEGIRPSAKACYFVAGKVIRRFGLSAGVGEKQIAELKKQFKNVPDRRAQIILSRAWHVLNSERTEN